MLTINITFFELKAIVENQDKEENKLIWNVEGMGDYDLFVLLDHLWNDDFESNELKLTAIGLSEPGEEDFIRGFCENAPYWYTTKDGSPMDDFSPCPWCAPWKKDKALDWFDPERYTAYEMGKRYAERIRPEMNAVYEAVLDEIEEEERDALFRE